MPSGKPSVMISGRLFLYSAVKCQKNITFKIQIFLLPFLIAIYIIKFHPCYCLIQKDMHKVWVIHGLKSRITKIQ